MEHPTLCEPGMVYFLKKSLKQCKNFRNYHSTLLFNLGATILLVVGVGGLLWYRYKGKPTQEDILARQQKTHTYLVSKLQQYTAMVKNTKDPNMINDLPKWT